MSCGTDLLDQTIASCDCLVVRSLSHFARQFVSGSQRGKQLIFTYFKGQQIGMYDVVSACFSVVQSSVHCLVRLPVL